MKIPMSLLGTTLLAVALTPTPQTLAQDKSSVPDLPLETPKVTPLPLETPEVEKKSAFLIANEKIRKHYTEKKMALGKINLKTDLWVVHTKGLVCDFCARSIIAVFKEQAFVGGLDVDLRKKILVVSLKLHEEQKTDDVDPKDSDKADDVNDVDPKDSDKADDVNDVDPKDSDKADDVNDVDPKDSDKADKLKDIDKIRLKIETIRKKLKDIDKKRLKIETMVKRNQSPRQKEA